MGSHYHLRLPPATTGAAGRRASRVPWSPFPVGGNAGQAVGPPPVALASSPTASRTPPIRA